MGPPHVMQRPSFGSEERDGFSVHRWLTALDPKFAQFAAVFQEHGFDIPSSLSLLTEDILREMGVPQGYSRVILHSAQHLVSSSMS
eukprot:NODE_3627_length_388_cov_369.283186_g3067_i0.p1 GENE.NODE_3627_length_388_cov_369.283186_g3067_i0~~NODE_3627_length_388_cov_369.283186_g3067_i0.p1  ORF type:complete len:86 (+),score=5.41 NODE_3627_length_388_cov_369.283186_g3067_i0:29-286(+)